MMDQATKKPMLTLRDSLIDAAQRGGGDQRPPKPLVGGSFPSGPVSFLKAVSITRSRIVPLRWRFA